MPTTAHQPRVLDRGIILHEWPTAKHLPARRVLLIVHGMGEHAGRYDEFARYCTDRGVAVLAPDLRGHGDAIAPSTPQGHFADHDGLTLLVRDINDVIAFIEREHPGIPIALLGHSMGSYLVQTVLGQLSSLRIDKAVLLGSTGASQVLPARLGILLARIMSGTRAKRRESRILKHAAFGRGYRKFPESRAAWLTRDRAIADTFLADKKRCGFGLSWQSWLDLLIAHTRLPTARGTTPKHVRILLGGGGDDAICKGREGQEQLAAAYRSAGADVSGPLVYEEARHEILNEINRADVYRDIVTWLEST